MSSERNALLRAGQEFSVEIAETPAMIEAAFRLRYQVYCRERAYEQGQGQRETDHFDPYARHVVLIYNMTGQVIGTTRVITGSESGGPGLPLQRLVSESLLRDLPHRTTGEVSRFALSKQLRGNALGRDTMLRLGLVQGTLRLSQQMGLTHWCAVMEPSLLRLLRASSIYFEPLGPVIDYHGLRQPCVASIGELFSRLRREQPHVWDYITQEGELLPPADVETS